MINYNYAAYWTLGGWSPIFFTSMATFVYIYTCLTFIDLSHVQKQWSIQAKYAGSFEMWTVVKGIASGGSRGRGDAPQLSPIFFHFNAVFGKNNTKQECIPVGCLPPACCPYLPACTVLGRGCLLPGGVWSGGCLLQVGCLWFRGMYPSMQWDPPCEQNHRHV